MRIAFSFLLMFFFIAALPAQTRYDVFIPMDDGDSLEATYFVPRPSSPTSRFPGILFVHGFGSNKDSSVSVCEEYAVNGHIAMCYSVRGHGNSSGLSTIMSMRERQDLAQVIGYLRSLPNIDTTRVGVNGGSQGGLHGLWAAADRLPVTAILSDVIVPHWATDMFMNGCIRRTFLFLLKSRHVTYAEIRDSLWELTRIDAYDSLKARFARDRDVDTAQLNSSPTPVFRSIKWQDHYFTAQDGIESFLRHRALKKLYLGTRGHFSDFSAGERSYQNSIGVRWFRYFLLGEQAGILDDPPISYAYSSLPQDTSGYFTWNHTEVYSWLPDGVQLVRLYLGPDSSLSYSPATLSKAANRHPELVSGSNRGSSEWMLNQACTGMLQSRVQHEVFDDSLVLHNEYRDSTYTFDRGYSDSFLGSRFDAALPKAAFVFTSQPLPDDIFWVGVPKMKLYVRSDYEEFPLHVQIYEEDSLGNKYFINRINFTARHWKPGLDSVVEVDGIPHAHKFTRGSHIRIEVTNIDKTNRIMYGEYPFVVPLFAEASATMYFGASYPSYIEVPMIGSPMSAEITSPTVPLTTTLFQNYPNPFNPVTVIRYSLMVNSRVSLKVYNVLGQEVATLVNEKLAAGSYSVEWDASGQSSGVYFYRLTVANNTETHSEVRRMLLLR
ncbi:MAG: T9SS type A sorting domain-containing protein [Ignavibacteriae bacterium]|nr:T9SS type A sorting domain-containing protein [Ignavibacteriota bacterium]